MSLAEVSVTPHAAPPSGGVHFVSPARRADAIAELRARRYVVAEVGVLSSGQLRGAVEETVEATLALRGALPPCVDVEAPIEAILRDQIFRARALGGSGLAIVLRALADAPGAVLAFEDGLALAAWL